MGGPNIKTLSIKFVGGLIDSYLQVSTLTTKLIGELSQGVDREKALSLSLLVSIMARWRSKNLSVLNIKWIFIFLLSTVINSTGKSCHICSNSSQETFRHLSEEFSKINFF